jgi:hypothetical protein
MSKAISRSLSIGVRILRICFENNPCDNLTSFDRRRELLSGAHDDPTINCLPTGPVAPAKLLDNLPVPARGLSQNSILHAAPFRTRGWWPQSDNERLKITFYGGWVEAN